MKKALILIYLIILSLATVTVAYPGVTRAASMTWYLTDSTTSIPTGADYWMNRGSGTGSSDLAMSSGTSKVWVANEAANFVLDMSGDWSVTLGITDRAAGAKLTVDIGYLSGSTFTSCGISASQILSVGTMSFSVTTTSHSISAGDYAAIRINCTAKSYTLDLTDSPYSPSYVSSPTGAPDYPGTEVISFTVTDNGADGINFGNLDMNVTDQAEVDQDPPTAGAVMLTVGIETNVDVYVQLQGTDFSGPATYLLSSADVQYDDDGTLDEGTETGKPQGTLDLSYSTWYSVPAYNSSVIQCYHWITVPSGQYAGVYTSTFYYQCIAQ